MAVRSKAKAGTVVILERNGRLSLRWSWQGKRYQFSLGLVDESIGQAAAEMKARQIEMDMTTGHFDPSLVKYKNDTGRASRELTGQLLLVEFAKSKSKLVAAKTLEKYQHVEKKLAKFARTKLAADYTERTTILFRDYLLTQISPISAAEYFSVINAAWEWGIAAGLLKENPWKTMISAFKVPPIESPQPFTLDEIRAIIGTMDESRAYRYYTPLIRFLFGTGCRTGEALGLRWGVIAEDISQIWIGESYKRDSARGATKMHKARTIYPSEKMQSLLLDIRPNDYDQTTLVFPAPRTGGYINDNNLSKRVWTRTLQRAGVPHRKLYNTRSTFISHALASGATPAKVAEIVGDRVETIYRHYVGNSDGSKTLPDIGI
ncbi:MAG: tyrosine-type recombinase/integrase [Cyanobacteria bacterium P01_A01_bin.137]